ncbi:tryptophan 2,3-dioxygenase [Aestuariibius sp. 2305UL40-4]|uniref:tryptophan 2,3-dioxygenase n=1 Tax=Aestuariibius violaceus TaxID=3234132 RepID=UPI00345EF490
MAEPYDPGQEGAHQSFEDRMSYGDYLKLDALLGAQAPLSTAHDELLFIVQHQTSELWMKLALHELNAARTWIGEERLPEALKSLSRVARIFEQLNGAWDVLRTMTPSDYTTFRDTLGQSSGFQSHQYRLIEFVLGNRNPAMLKPHAHRPAVHAELVAETQRLTLYDMVLAHVAAAGLPVPEAVLRRDRSSPYVANDDVTAVWQTVYRAPAVYWEIYELAEKLVDLEDYFRRWRFNHVTTVERVIGLKRGTGGTSGVSYLRRMLEVVLFPELWQVRTGL